MKVVDFTLGDPSKVATGWTLAIVPEGYTQAELDKGLFEADVKTFVTELLSTPPFNDPAIRTLLNVVKVRKASTKTGNTITLLNPAPASSPFQTAFGAMFGREISKDKKQIKRSLYGESAAVKAFVRGQPGLAPVNHFLVIVNNTKLYGGSMHDEVGWFSKEAEDWPKVGVHELGHQAFGLDDEYPYQNDNDPVGTYPAAGREPSAPNVTTVTDIPKMKWGDLVTLPQSLVPTTVKPPPYVRNPPIKQANPPIPADAIGAYEGAGQYDYGLYRPSLNCKMREHSQRFCRVCEGTARAHLGHYKLIPKKGLNVKVGLWTHMQTFLQTYSSGYAYRRMLAYNAGTGAYAINNHTDFGQKTDRRPDGTPPFDSYDPTWGTGSIGPGWTWLVPFTLNGTPHYFAHEFGAGRQGMFQMNSAGGALTQTWSTPPGTTWTHIVTLTVAGAPHYIGYNSFTGNASLYRIDDNASDPTFLTAMQWGQGHTAVLSIPLDGAPFVLTYRIITGEVMIRRITPSGFTMAFASASNFWVTNLTHLALLDFNARPYVVRYSGIDGRGSIYHVRAGGAGLDRVCNLVPPPGPGGLSILGVGAPALGKLMTPKSSALGGGFYESLFFYSALGQTLQTYDLA